MSATERDAPFNKSPNNSADFRTIISNKNPLMDVRAPIEFEKGAFNHSINHPLMNNDERAAVGLCYKNNGQAAAITLGNKLVTGQSKARRLSQWQEFARAHPQGYLYCFRGGLRSQTVQTWLADAGVSMPRIEGGYKALRQFLLNELERLTEKFNFVVVAGNTGSAKTVLINQIANSVDLEGLANHRGSSFGQHITPQPSQIDFENNLTIALMRAEQAGHTTIVLEDESQLIGRCAMPHVFREKQNNSPVIELQVECSERQAQIHQEYVTGQLVSFCKFLGPDEGFGAFANFLSGSLLKISRRLGGERYKQLKQWMDSALQVHQATGDTQAHYDWIAPLLDWYYDPMYSYQIEKKRDRVVFQGDTQRVLDYLNSESS